MPNSPQILDINDAVTLDTANHFMRHSAIIVQLPSVYALFSMPNQTGAAFIDRAKNRRTGKNYGTTIGKLQSFLSMSQEDSALTRTFCDPDLDPMLRRHFEGSLNRAFLRIKIAAKSVNNTVIRDGTHQALILTGDHGRLFFGLEKALSDTADKSLFGGNVFSAPICSSANISGDPEGSITTWDRAYDFACQRDIPLIIRANQSHGEQGSFPIFSLENDKVLIHREGPMLDELKTNIEKIVSFDRNGLLDEKIRIAA